MLKILAITFLVLAPLKWIYVVDEGLCNGCGNCLSHCPQGALTMTGPDAYIDPELCDGCGNCVNFCPRNAIYKAWYTGIEEDEASDEMLSLSCNPVNAGSVIVTGTEPQSEVKVLDGAGRMVLREFSNDLGQLTLDISGIPEGIYLVVSEDRILILTSI